MVGTILGGFALLVALGALWFAGEASKKSEFQQHQFYEAHVKGLRVTVQDTAKTVLSMVGQLEKLNKSGSSGDGDEELSQRVKLIEEQLAKLGTAVEQVGTVLAAMKARG